VSSWQWLLAVGGATLVVYAAFIAWLLLVGCREHARAVAGFIPDCVILLRRLLGDERVPYRSKLLLAALIGYLALPFDLVPDFIPVAGQLDDAIIVAIVLRSVLRAGGPDLLRTHWPGPPASMKMLLRLVDGCAPTYQERVATSAAYSGVRLGSCGHDPPPARTDDRRVSGPWDVPRVSVCVRGSCRAARPRAR
jgi:uncharacterized membrane protein YkvA (DUF1232 family)